MKRDIDIEALKESARRIRVNIVRMIHAAGSGHPGGSLSAVEVLVALYKVVMRHRPDDPAWQDRDRFILSKGHGCPALYAALAEAGYIPEDSLLTLRKLDSPYQGHPDRRRLAILEANTGSLGQGLSQGIGMAIAARLDRSARHVWVMLGDGECDEGQVWEAVLSAPNHGLDNLTAIVDYNKYQLDDSVEAILPLDPLAEKWRSCNWEVREVDGHDLAGCIDVLGWARSHKGGRPTCVIAHTVKGKGVSFMEQDNKWHGQAPNDQELAAALEELKQPH